MSIHILYCVIYDYLKKVFNSPALRLNMKIDIMNGSPFVEIENENFIVALYFPTLNPYPLFL